MQVVESSFNASKMPQGERSVAGRPFSLSEGAVVDSRALSGPANGVAGESPIAKMKAAPAR